jgi:hypothetical protein
MSVYTTSIPTVEQVREKCERAVEIIKSYPMCLDATIDDYPIGGSNRGKCRLQVERAAGKGYRTVKTTTDKHGRWCKPHKGIYRPDVTVVVTGPGGDRDAQWLAAGLGDLYLSSANGRKMDIITLAPHYTEPRREPFRYTLSTIEIDGQEVTREYSMPADPPELCDAWDEWKLWVKIMRGILTKVWDEQEGKS